MRYWKYIFVILLLIFVLLCLVIAESPDSNLHVIACDVGQGDAILITYKNIQILTDGGPNNNVLTCLSNHMPFWDRGIELVILTHPQKDHYFGLIEVFKRYKVDNLLHNEEGSSSPDYQVLERRVGGSGVNVIKPYTGQTIRLGLIWLDIVNPPQGFTDPNANNIGIVDVLTFGSFKAIFTADVENEISDKLALLPQVRNVNYLKVNHHGSKNGLSVNLLGALSPQVAVISDGKNNTYGHPHKEILDLLDKYSAKVYRTDLDGEVEIATNGKDIWRKN